MGIAPSRPSSKFGYMVPGEPLDGCEKVVKFVEKPPEQEAKVLMEKGALWNGGVFAFRLGYLLDIVERYLGFRGYDRLLAGYHELDAVSFDHAVTEKAQSVAMVSYGGTWKDLGTWDALAHEIGEEGKGRHIPLQCTGTVVVNELPLPVVTLGTDNLVVVAGRGGILVATPEASGRLKDALDEPAFHMLSGFVFSDTDAFVIRDEGVARTRRIELESGKTFTLLQDVSQQVLLVCEKGEGELFFDGKSHSLFGGSSIALPKATSIAISALQRLSLLQIVWESS